MAREKPQTGQDLLAIGGVGQAKLEKYGNHFLDTITEYCVANGKIQKKPSPPGRA